jgi:hypothetical protein
MTLTIRLAGDRDREAIYRMRHRVYAEELGQHARRSDARLHDDLDGFNQYIVAGSARSSPPASRRCRG